MCVICVELVQNKLTPQEARRNLSELHIDMPKKHVHEILQLIWQKEDEELSKLGSD